MTMLTKLPSRKLSIGMFVGVLALAWLIKPAFGVVLTGVVLFVLLMVGLILCVAHFFRWAFDIPEED
jgi:hypothetical protein